MFTLVDTMLSLDPQRRFKRRRNCSMPFAQPAVTRKARLSQAARPGRVYRREGGESARQARDRFKELGYRVMISGEPTRAWIAIASTHSMR